MGQKPKHFAQYYPPHHYIFLPLTFIAFIFFLYKYFTESEVEYAYYAFFMFCFLFLALMLRQHYALMLQDRLIKQELRFRYYVVTGKRFEPIESQLKDKQVFSLRYAGDNELEALVHETVEKNLEPKEIRERIQNWKPDNERV